MIIINRTKLFVKNFVVYGFGGIISKVVPLIMVPIITRMMPSAFYYGISDLSNTIVSLFSSLAIMGMYDAMYRMFFEKDDENYKKDICSNAFFFTLLSSTVVSIVMVCLQTPISNLFYTNPEYGYLVMLCAISVLIGGTNSIIAAPTRMQNKWKIYLIVNLVSPTICYSITIPLLLAGHYLIALPLAGVIAGAVIEIAFYILNRKWFSFKRINWKHIKSMLLIALPLLPNFIIYWIFNSSDRVMISNLIGPDASGIYAVAAKIGQISQLIYLAFAGGWQYFAFSIMKDKDNVQILSKILEILAAVSFVTTLIGTSICKWGVQILFEEEYWSCYLCIPYLYMAPLLLMLFQVGSNQFLVIKKTWPNLLILSSGAAINVALNFVLIPIIGIEGASIATFIGYFVSIVLCLIVLLKMKLIEVGWKFLLNTFLFIVVFLVMRINNLALYYVNIPLAVAYLIFNIIIYKNDIRFFIIKMKLKKNTETTESIGTSPSESSVEESTVNADDKQ